MSRHSTLYVGNTSVLRLTGLRDQDGEAQVGATVTLESFADRSGVDVSGISLPAVFSDIGGGTYELQIEDDLGAIAGTWYTARIRAVSATGAVLVADERVRAAVRRA